MRNLETSQRTYHPGQDIQDKDGVDYRILSVDEKGVSARDLVNPQRIRWISYEELKRSFTGHIHENRNIHPVSPRESILYEDPQSSAIVKRIAKRTQTSAASVFVN